MNQTNPDTPPADTPMPKSLIEDKELARMAPEQLVSGFTRTPVVLFLVVAFVAHILVIGGTSASYIYYNHINPEAGALREQRLEQERKAKLDAELKQKAGKSMADQPADAEPGSDKPEAGEGDGEGADAEADADAGKSPVERRIEETAAPDEIPSLDNLLRPTE